MANATQVPDSINAITYYKPGTSLQCPEGIANAVVYYNGAILSEVPQALGKPNRGTLHDIIGIDRGYGSEVESSYITLN